MWGAGGGGDEEGRGGEAEGKVVDIKRLTKNPYPIFFIFLFFVVGEGGAGQGRVGQGKRRCWLCVNLMYKSYYDD